MNNTTRIVNQPPKEDISPEDFLSTNAFIPSIDQTRDLSIEQKNSFRNYMENKTRNKQVQKAINSTQNEEYDFFASVPVNLRKSNVVEKNKKDIIKIEIPSIIDIDTRNRDKNSYPEPSDFNIPLGKTFYNVKSIELVSSTIPNTDQTITNTPIEIRNNRISWQNSEDADLGRFQNRTFTSIAPVGQESGYVYVTITNHNITTNIRDGNFYIEVSNSTDPDFNGMWLAQVVSSDLLKVTYSNSTSGTATIDTGIPNYTVELTPGNYNASTISTEIQKQMNLVKRRKTILNYPIFHYFTVDVNLDTDVMTFRSYITKQLQGNPLDTIAGSGVVKVNSISHGFKTGDSVLIIGAKTVSGLTSNILNGLFEVTVLNSDQFQYEVNERANGSGIGGGTTCKTGQPSSFRLIFDTAESLIVNNIGFPAEDSSEALGTNEAPLTTKALNVTDATQNGSYLTFTTSVPHSLIPTNIIPITDITVGEHPIVTTSVDHGLQNTENVYISYPYTDPALESFFSVTSTSKHTFMINNLTVASNSGGTGSLKHGGDSIKISGFKSIPIINGIEYLVEAVTGNTFDIKASVTDIQASGLESTVIGTKQISVYHQNHGYNIISSITTSGSSAAQVTTVVKHGLTGKKFTGVNKTYPTPLTNIVFIDTVIPHGLSTSDSVFISNSTGVSIDGTYFIQLVSATEFSVYVVGGTDETGTTCDINIGDTVIFSQTNSIPSISTNANGIVNFYVEYIDDYNFKIETGFPITVPGTYGILGRDNKIALHRVTSSEYGSSTLGGIPLRSINSIYYPIYEIIDENNYKIRVNDYATSTVTSGGSSTTITSNIHGYRNFQSNTFNGEESGVLYKSISLEGENYIYLTSPGLQTVFVPGNQGLGDVFSRIVLSEPPGNMLFNTFVTVPKEFNPPLRYLKEISFKVKRTDGILFNFKDIDYSLSLRIIEVVDRIINSEISSSTGTSDLY